MWCGRVCVRARVCADQVMQVVREQITRALAMKPSSLDQLKNKLRGLNYSEILRLRQSERMSQDDFQSPPIMSVCVSEPARFPPPMCRLLLPYPSPILSPALPP